jgi:hypothetical protein
VERSALRTLSMMASMRTLHVTHARDVSNMFHLI